MWYKTDISEDRPHGNRRLLRVEFQCDETGRQASEFIIVDQTSTPEQIEAITDPICLRKLNELNEQFNMTPIEEEVGE